MDSLMQPSVAEGFRLSPQQRRVWAHQRRVPGAPLRVGCLVSIDGPVEPGRLRAGLLAIVENHEILRTSFLGEALPMQVIGATAELDWREEALASLTPEDPASRFEAMVREPVPGGEGGRLRARLYHLGTGRHALHLDLPALIMDRAGLRLLVAELARISAADEGIEAPQLQYIDISEWRNGLSGERERTFWQRQALASVSSSALPFGRGAESPAFQPRIVRRTLDPAQAERLAELAGRMGSTVDRLFLTVWLLLLQRLSAAPRQAIAVYSDGRSYGEISAAMGLFGTYLPVCPELKAEEPLATALRRVEETLSEAFDVQEYFLAEDLAGSAADGGAWPYCFDYRETAARSSAGETRFEILREHAWTELFGLQLSVVEAAGRIDCELHFDAAIYGEAEISILADRLVAFLAAAVRQPDAPTGDWSLLGEEERRRLVADFNSNRAAFPDRRPLHLRIAEQTALRPRQAAVVYEGQEISYAELDARASGLASALRRRGVGPETAVGLLVHRSLETLIGILGIWKADGAYVPLDPRQPRERLSALVREAGLAHVITQNDLVSMLADASCELLSIESGEVRNGDTKKIETDVVPGNLAYVLFTSGSTGRPKAVAVEHRQLANYVDAILQVLDPGEGASFATVSTFAADLGNTVIFPALVSGGCLHVISEERLFDAASLSEYLSGRGVDFLKIVPSHLEALMASGGEALLPRRALVLGGELLRPALVARIAALRPSCRVFNHYGPTETTVGALFFPASPDALEPGLASVPIGSPLANLEAYLLGPDLEPAATWETGEIFLGGAGLARGYLGRPEATAERFMPNPLAEEPGERLYRTGDLARHLPGDRVEFLGRADHQVKIRGFRIELGEIEARLAEHAAVERAVVVLREDREGDRRLVAYVVARAPVAGGALRDFLAERLPDHMVPARIVLLESFPLTANGKVDRAALPASEEEAEKGPAVTPRTTIEQRIAAIWGELLRAAPAGVADSFFALGGHSLLAIQLISRVRAIFGVELSLRSLLAEPTVAGMALAIARARAGQADAETGGAALPPVVPDPASRFLPFPLNEVQQAYWLGRKAVFELGNVSTHTYVEFESPALDLKRFGRAVDRLVERHDMLRAVLTSDGMQRILERVPSYLIGVLDLRSLSPEQAAPALQELRTWMAHHVLPVEVWPLFMVRVSLLPEGRTRLHVSRDALVFDARSTAIVFQELIEFYSDPDLRRPPLELSFRDYVSGLVELEKSDAYREAWQYWLRRLDTLPPGPDLPVRQESAKLDRPRFSGRRNGLEPALWTRLRERGASIGLTPSGLILAVFAEVLAAWSRKPVFTINLTLFNRLPRHPQVQEIVGDFTSITLLAVDNSRPDPFEMRARRIQEQLWDDLDHRSIGGVAVLRELAKRRGRQPGVLMPVVLTSTLTLEPANRSEVSESLPMELVYGLSETSQVWLDHQVSESGGWLLFNWDAVDDLFLPGVLDEMFAAYCALLDRLAREDSAWSEIQPVRLPPAQEALWAQYNATAAELPPGLLHAGFEEQARQAPERLAVASAPRRLTYGELESESRTLGWLLRDAGARLNRLVAVVMEKGWEQVVAVLGVLRAGAAYLPIDAGVPRERLWRLLELGEVSLVVTQPWLMDRLEWPSGMKFLTVEASPAEEPRGSLPAWQAPGDLAYVIFTSGSTGEPKGVMIDHRGALNTIVDLNARCAVGPDDRVLALSSLSFDLSVYDVFGLLSAGGALVVPEADSLRDPERWLAWMDVEGVTLWNTVPALLEMLVEHALHRGGGGKVRGPRLRQALLSGDWIAVSLPTRVWALWPEARLLSLGGATEGSIWSIGREIGTVDPSWMSIPYGRPLRNQTMHVLDGSLSHRPVWVPGELYIGGVGVSQGYWGSGDKTARSFVPDPGTGDRLYRTGDWGRLLASGEIEFLGREDAQVKIQGHRIELGEIESVLLRHPSVATAVVSAVGADRTNRRLVAYVVPRREGGGEEPSARPVLVEPPPPSLLREARAGGLDHVARLELKLAQPGVRRDLEEAAVLDLAPRQESTAAVAATRERRSHRRFRSVPAGWEAMSGLLGTLLPRDVEPYRRPKFRYPSAGSLYPVQVYLYARPGGIAGVEPGLYYLDPSDACLVQLAAGPVLHRGAYSENNWPIFDQSGFALFLVGCLRAIASVYGDRARAFCLLEAGYMGQLLMEAAAGFGLGLCPIGSVDLGGLRGQLGLAEEDVLLHSLLGGMIAEPAPGGAAPYAVVPAEESSPEASSANSLQDAARLGRIPLAGPDPDAAAWLKRRTYRSFGRGPSSPESLGELLEVLRQLQLDDHPMPKYRYPSAGDLYPVQAYVVLRPGAVEGVAEGTYYYHPRRHALLQLSPDGRLDPGLYTENNRAVVEQAGFAILLVSRPSANEPVYGRRAHEFCLLEAGYLGQALMETAPVAGLGLCPVGSFDLARLAARLALEPGQQVVHSFLGGPLPAPLSSAAARGAGSDTASRPRSAPSAPPAVARVGAGSLTAESLRALLRRQLPEYMVPSDILLLDRIPLTANGKVDRAALPQPQSAGLRAGRGMGGPHTPRELQLVGIFERLLDNQPIDLHDNFFDLGGDSLLAIRLANEVRSRLGVELPLAMLFRGATLEELAAALGEPGRGAASNPLVALNAASQGRPFFCVHAAGGGVASYVELAYRLRDERPFYGLQALVPEGDEDLASVEALAERYVRAVREVQPHGPYLLGGWSFGGHVAYEMARRLREEGEAVDRLVVVDTFRPAEGETFTEPDSAEILSAVVIPELGLTAVGLRAQGGLDDQLGFLIKLGKQAGTLPQEFGIEEARRYFELCKAHLAAGRKYSPLPYPGRLLLVRAEASRPVRDDPTLGWARLARSGVEVRVVPGAHHTLLRVPHVEALADCLRDALATAAGEGSRNEEDL